MQGEALNFSSFSKPSPGSIRHVWETVSVPLGDKAYDILIGPGLLTEIGKMLKSDPIGESYFIITDSNVEDYVGIDLMALMGNEGLSVDMLSFPAGEASKNMDTVVTLARALLERGADRKSAILALGGGVSGDIAGFLASIYMRGIPFAQIPTTLLAQVDSSVGGKTGVDLPDGKNLLGTFYQPRRVFADIGVLSTLSQSELKNGLAEVVKYGMIRDPGLFQLLEEKWWDIVNLEPMVTAHIVKVSCAIKADVVANDEFEGGLRRILNFGHTVGHAVEAGAGYQIPHGEAVAIGMMVVSRLSVYKALMPEEDLKRLDALLEKLGLPRHVPSNIATEEILNLTRHDKKVQGGRVHFVLSKGIGKTLITDEISNEELARAIEGSRG